MEFFFLFIVIFTLSQLIGKFLQGSSDASEGNTTRTDGKTVFWEHFLTLIAVVMRADGELKKSELQVVKNVLQGMESAEEAQKHLYRLREKLNSSLAGWDASSLLLRRMVSYSIRRDLVLHLLFMIACADEVVSSEELGVLERIASGLGISAEDVRKKKAEFGFWESNDRSSESNRKSCRPEQSRISLQDAYRLLGVQATSTDEEIKKAYRAHAMKCHPDRVANMGPEAVKKATQAFQKVQSAYEAIRAARSMS
ncbi:MAG: TerB family tellurite resistance protein [Kiritimatiellia bacterium]